jgi:hypothetical protein
MPFDFTGTPLQDPRSRPLHVRFRPVLAAVAAVSLCGCSQIEWSRVGDAAKRGATDPLTWGGTAAAALFAVNGNSLDIRLSDWARENTPLFGSRREALDASDRLRNTADVAVKLAAVLEPTPKRGSEWLWDKSRTLLLESTSASLTLNTTGVLKRATGRQRPGNSASTDSFPSAHASTAFHDASLGNLYLQRFNLPAGGKNLLSTGFYALAGGTAWARVEGGVHYPSDVLFGAALGNFFAIFIHDAFIRSEALDGPQPLSVSAAVDAVTLHYRVCF